MQHKRPQETRTSFSAFAFIIFSELADINRCTFAVHDGLFANLRCLIEQIKFGHFFCYFIAQFKGKLFELLSLLNISSLSEKSNPR